MPESSGEFVTVVLYGSAVENNAKTFLDLFVRIADRYKIRLASTEVCVEGSEKFRNPRFKKLSQEIEQGVISKASCLTLYPSQASFRELGYSKIILSFSAEMNNDLGWVIVVAIDKSDIQERRSEATCAQQVREIIVECTNVAKPRYGFATTVPHEMHPILFANSIQCSVETEEVMTRNFAFFNARDAHLKDQIRDVFEFNVLSSDHLCRRIGADTFRGWIEHGGHGSFREIQPDVWLWEVKIGQIPRYRRELDATKVLIESSPNEEVLSALVAVHGALTKTQDEG